MHAETIHSNAHRAFTLIELMVVVTIAAVLATMVLPMMRNDDRLSLVATSSLVTSDIEFAQSLSISNPSRPAAIKFTPMTSSYHIAYADDLDTPMTRSDTGAAYAVTFGQGRATSAKGVTMRVDHTTNNTIIFESHGGLTDFSETPIVTLRSGDKWIKLTIEPTTGSISETGN